MEKTQYKKKRRSVSQKMTTNKYSCRTIFTPTNTVEDDGPECLFLVWNLIIATFFTEFTRGRFWNIKHCNVFCFFFGGGNWFSDGVRLFMHRYQKIKKLVYRTVDAKELKTKESKEAVRAFRTMTTKTNRLPKFPVIWGKKVAERFKKICKAEGL